MITEVLLVESQTCTPLLAEKWCVALRYTCSNFYINTPERVAGFLAQVGHESGGFRVTTEDLHYRAEALTRVWPQRFPPGVAESYAMQPEKIANRAKRFLKQLRQPVILQSGGMVTCFANCWIKT